jgi:hypothetical protein
MTTDLYTRRRSIFSPGRGGNVNRERGQKLLFTTTSGRNTDRRSSTD